MLLRGKITLAVVSAALIVGGIISAKKYIIPEGEKAQDISGLMSAGSAKPGATPTNKCIEIGVNTWGGFVGGQYWNGGFKDNAASKFREDGICVNFHKMDDFAASRAAFQSGQMDLMWVTVDAFPTESGNYGENVKFLWQIDYSRGGDAIVTKGNIKSVGDLAGKTIALAEGTPSHTLFLWMLDLASLSPLDVNLVKVANGIDAAAAFKAGKVDAAVVWSPDDQDCLQAVAGSKVLINTKQASNIIADGFMVKESVLNKRRDELTKLVRGWLKGSAEINSNSAAKSKGAKIVAEGYGVDEAFAMTAINNTRLTTYGDNLDFFGINSGFSGVTAKDLYEKMTVVYGKLNLAKNSLPYSKIVDVDFIKGLNMQSESGMAAETVAAFKAPTTADVQAPVVASKPVRVSFEHGSSVLDENAKSIIDMSFAEQVKAFPTSRIRIEGNTDNTGSDSVNRTISKARAQAVVEYLVTAHKMDRNRFVTVGNGPDKPLCKDDTEVCRSKNRRTDFQILEAK